MVISGVMPTDEIKADLKKILSQKRYIHSLGVADEAERLARRYGANPDKAFLAGLVHDCAKEFPPDKNGEHAQIHVRRFGGRHVKAYAENSSRSSGRM